MAPTVALNAVPRRSTRTARPRSPARYTDIGLLDAHTLTVNWDDPNNATDSTFAIPAIRNAAGMATLNVGDTFNSSTDGAVPHDHVDQRARPARSTFSVQHQYLDDGLAPGNNTASDTSTIGVTVADDDTQSGSNTEPVTGQERGPHRRLECRAR